MHEQNIPERISHTTIIGDIGLAFYRFRDVYFLIKVNNVGEVEIVRPVTPADEMAATIASGKANVIVMGGRRDAILSMLRKQICIFLLKDALDIDHCHRAQALENAAKIYKAEWLPDIRQRLQEWGRTKHSLDTVGALHLCSRFGHEDFCSILSELEEGRPQGGRLQALIKKSGYESFVKHVYPVAAKAFKSGARTISAIIG